MAGMAGEGMRAGIGARARLGWRAWVAGDRGDCEDQAVDEPQITNQAEYWFLHDAEFHAKVKLAVATIERERGVQLDEPDRSLATLAAAVALLIPGPLKLSP
jgi:hypothetical protein